MRCAPLHNKNELRCPQKCSGIILYDRGFYLLAVLTLTIQQWSSSIHTCSPTSALWCSAGVCPRVLQGSSIIQVTPRQQTVDHKSPLSPSPSVHLWMSLSLPFSLRQYNKSRHVPTRHQQPDLVHEPAPRPRRGGAEDQKGGGGKPRKKIPSMTQPASVG